MNRRNRVRHQWTHRRLGLGAAQPADAALTRTESLLAAVGARRTPAVGVPGDAFEAALFDLVCDVDLTIGLPALEATPVPLTELRTAQPIRRRRQLFSWLIPAATSGVAVVVIAITAVFVDPAIPTSPALAAAAESRQLLTHADSLLTAASHAAVKERAKLVTEARADLSHVSQLLPLAAPQTRSEIRERMEALDQRAKPLTAKPTRTTGVEDAGPTDDPSGEADAPLGGSDSADASESSAGTAGGSGGQNPPRRHRPGRRPPAPDADGGQRTDGSPPATDGRSTSTEGITTQPAPRPQPTSGTRPPPPDGTTQQGTNQQSPSGGAPQPRP